jgi:catechol 2,3-dioxygenase-like lactoylglutathione lyase family enzyme
MAASPHVTKINHTGISVRSIDRSLEFYCGLLGLELVFDLDVDGHPGLEAVVGMDGVTGRVVFLDTGSGRLELWEYQTPLGDDLPADHRPANIGVSHVSFEVSDVDEIHQRLTEAGVYTTTAPLDLGIHKTFYAKGPDGEYLEFLEDRSDLVMLQRSTQRNLERRQAKEAQG